MPIDLSLIVARTLDGVIGKDGELPWKLPSDLRRFKEITTDIGTVIMGRKTLKAIQGQLMWKVRKRVLRI